MIWFDCETYCETPITHGTYQHAERCEIMIITYAFDAGPVECWDVTDGSPMPGDLEYALHDSDDLICAHSSMFDRNVLRLSTNFAIDIPITRWRDTLVKALAHGLPGGLGILSEILGVDIDKAKDKAGRQLIHLFCKPRPKNSKIRRATRATHPVEWQRFVDYARLDIEAMRAVDQKLPHWNYSGTELALWHLDQRINDRGCAIDLDLAESAVRATARANVGLAARATALTDGAVSAATQRDKMLAHILAEYDIDLPNMQADTLKRRIADPELPDALRELLNVRLQASTTSVSKYKTLIKGVSTDGRLRGTLQFNGAQRTGRWAGRLFQPQNLFRPDMALADIDLGIEAMKADCADLTFENPTRVAANAVRGAVIAPPGKKLVISDLSNIEGRVVAWLAGEAWKLQAFRDFDAGLGPDIYKLAYAKAFGIAHTDVSKQQRQIGKVMELMLGYQGGVGAFLTGAATYGINLEELADAAFPSIPRDVLDEAANFWQWTREKKRPTFGLTERTFTVCDSIKRMWRRAHPKIEALWSDLEGAFIAATFSPGKAFDCGLLTLRKDAAWLRIIMPSGRALCYPSAQVDDSGKCSYKGINQYSRQWQRLKTYGGKLTENVTQAVARDVMAHNMPTMEMHDYQIVLTVHDEVVTEAPDEPAWSVALLSDMLAAAPPWAAGLPLAADGFEAKRYRKE